MSIKTEIERIEANAAAAYTALPAKGGMLPSARTSANLASAIDSIPLTVRLSPPLRPAPRSSCGRMWIIWRPCRG